MFLMSFADIQVTLRGHQSTDSTFTASDDFLLPHTVSCQHAKLKGYVSCSEAQQLRYCVSLGKVTFGKITKTWIRWKKDQLTARETKIWCHG